MHTRSGHAPRWILIPLGALGLGIILSAGGCDDSAAEDAAEDTADALEEAADEVGDAIDDTADTLGDTAGG